MRSFFTLLFGLTLVTMLSAQPANDDCTGLIDLGNLPACSGETYTNINATASNIGSGNAPSCFNGGVTDRDVWFAFTTTDDISDISILVDGTSIGSNAQSIQNPQIAIYRGTCGNNALSEIGCFSAEFGANNARLDIVGLSPNTQYFIRVNDYSATAAPRSGDFTICVQEIIAEFNMGEASGSTACFGTLYDSGGPDGDYGNFEDFTFTICPTQPNACLEIDLVNFNIEPQAFNGLFGEELNFYAGDNTDAPLISSLSGQDIGSGFRIQSSTGCITVEFESDFLLTFSGFELNWQCSATPCDNRSIDNPIEITSIPFQQGGISTCESASTFAETNCAVDNFLNGPEYVFTYTSTGNECIGIEIGGAAEGTGVLLLNGPPTDESTICVAQGSDGSITAASLREPGTYYIIVANRLGCTLFDISIQEADCSLSPALLDALGNPLNGCFAEFEGLPTVFDFEEGFQDIEVEADVNAGCWLNSGLEPSYYWFTIQAQEAGKLGFIIESANEDVQSDLDFNVWGPFTQNQVINNPDSVVAFIRNNAPIRSSWSPTPGPTGLADTHPVFNTPVTDEYDCGDEAGPEGDDFVRTIDAQEGEVYAVLINDWGGFISEDGVSIDWSPSDPGVLDVIAAEVITGDTAVCSGESVQIIIESPVNDITWLNDTNTLSCTNCPNPVATPTETTTYRAFVNAFCYNDTVDVTVQVFDVDAGPDATVCIDAKFDIQAGSNFEDGTYAWNVPAGLTLSCTDCPRPTVTANQAGVYTLGVTLTTPNCTLQDEAIITVLNGTAPQFNISEDQAICRGDSISIGDANPAAGVTFTWTASDGNFASDAPNPVISPEQRTTYFVEVMGADCPVTTMDSLEVSVSIPPIIQLGQDTMVCQEQPLLLARSGAEPGVTYQWTGPETIVDATDPNTLVFPTNDGNYILTATRGACEVKDTINIDITPIDIEIQTEDTVFLCLGEQLALAASVTPAAARVVWTPGNGSLSDTVGVNVIATPKVPTTYYATVTVDQCVRVDSVFVQVDSLPTDLAIMPADTSVCEGSQVILKSPVYEPRDFMTIEFLWAPADGQQTPDSLYNMVVQPTDTTEYFRIATNGACIDTTYAVVNVKPIPILQIVPADTLVCPGERVDLQVNGPDGLEELMWMPADGLSCTDCLDPTATVSFTTAYQFMAELNGCPGQASANVNAYPNPELELNTQTEICLGESIQLNFRAVPGITYTWTASNDPSFSSNDPLLEVSPTETTTYTVVAQAPNCDTRLEADIRILVVPLSDVTVSPDQQICQGESVTLTADGTAPAGATETFAWRWNGQSAFGASITIDGLTEDTQVELTYVYGGNCNAVRKIVSIDVLDNIVISGFAIDPEAYGTTGVPSGDMVSVAVETLPATPSGVTYSWTANGEAIGGNSPQIQDQPTVDPTIYEVTIVTANGCTTTQSTTLMIIPPRHTVPNAFTPNGDGRNDFFNVVSKGSVEIVEFRVYNRWGKLVYDNNDPTNGWNGQDNGNPAPSDVYAYYIIVRYPDGSEFIEQGDVTLIR